MLWAGQDAVKQGGTDPDSLSLEEKVLAVPGC